MARTRADKLVVLILLFIVMAWAAGTLVVLGLCAGAAAGDHALAVQLAASGDLA